MSRGILTPINVEGYSHLYSITKNGRVWSVRSKRFIKPSFTQKYAMIQLWKDGKVKLISVHRLVALTYIPNPNHLPFVNHKDENISNNDVDNLEWCTHQYNITYGTASKRRREHTDYGAIPKSQRQIWAKNGTEKQQRPVLQILDGKVIQEFYSIGDAVRHLNPNTKHCGSNISKVCRGLRKTAYGYEWKYKEV